MHRKEVNERSPMRVLEHSIRGGLGSGNIGVVVARPGLGKTAFLVGIAMDYLLRSQKVLHVSLDHTVEKVRDYYDDIYAEIAHKRELEDVWKVRVEMERNRRIHCYPPDKFSSAKLREAIGFMKDHGEFEPVAIVIDGWNFQDKTVEDIRKLRSIAEELQAEVWMSATTHRESERNERGVPEPIAHLEGELDVILSMAHDGNSVHVGLHKDHENPDVTDMKLKLDPTTMLLCRKR
jgi:hypothetical protein